MNNLSISQSLYLGAAIGLVLSALAGTYIPVYHNFLVYQWTHFWPLAIIGVLGAYIGYATDKS